MDFLFTASAIERQQALNLVKENNLNNSLISIVRTLV